MARELRRRWAEKHVGRTVGGRYELRRVLGLGGMGVVYEAWQEDLGREVALKTVLPEQLHADGGARLLREARLAAGAAGPGVVAVHDVGEDDVLGPYLVMERLEGESLEARLAGGPLPVREAARVGGALLETLAAVHAVGLVHRDLKPENVFLAARGGGAPPRVTVLDFGVARPPEESGEETLTATGAAIGTPRYMAPEQAAGGDVDARADLYAVGAILYRALSGEKPYAAFRGRDALLEVLRAGPPAPLGELVPGLASALVGVIERAMAREPEARFADAAAFRAALADAAGEGGAVSTGGAALDPTVTESGAEPRRDGDGDGAGAVRTGAGSEEDASATRAGAGPEEGGAGPEEDASGTPPLPVARRRAAPLAIVGALVVGGVIALVARDAEAPAPELGQAAGDAGAGEAATDAGAADAGTAGAPSGPADAGQVADAGAGAPERPELDPTDPDDERAGPASWMRAAPRSAMDGTRSGATMESAPDSARMEADGTRRVEGRSGVFREDDF
ncbi:MAG TPA: serine/threonine-protein kinase [Polyangiaceae bacterium LLY-WYZ-15_(1-7)]|nr:serine/threonine-protein kinase [Polyangiaceae bacterium LLY-WYZ-15_(1-7)]HJL13062.1 serine/threonine-protein kinase [Polyangiaceae bacterium LLY-WYZ-15_(1-7)]HJL26911.1 serine/threonine-protein kinase [Polyangiaceae bacterium LLY-WYZ-15_(1-7)]